MINPAGKLLICERLSQRGAWQFPQGGVDSGESHIKALRREVHEEIGLRSQHYKIVLQRDGYRYLYPEEVREKKVRKHGNHGQIQTYFLCRLKPGSPDPNVDQRPAEFRDYKWIQPKHFDISWVPAFKQNVYRAVMHDFFGIKL